MTISALICLQLHISEWSADNLNEYGISYEIEAFMIEQNLFFLLVIER